MYLVTIPKIAQAVQVKVTVEDHFGGKKVSAYLGPLSEWVCIQDHTGSRPAPPAGFGSVAGTGVPHVHTPTGPVVLDDGLWVVVMEGQAYVMAETDVWNNFQKVNGDFTPLWQQKDEWKHYKSRPNRNALMEGKT